MWFIRSILVLTYFASVLADTPANCTFEDIQGSWTFSIGSRGHDRTISCKEVGTVVSTLKVELFFPNLVVDQFGNEGRWTIIYNQGFEVSVAGRKYFAFSKYKGKGKNATSICNETLPGWSHDVFDRDWACYSGAKDTPVPPKFHLTKMKQPTDRLYKTDIEFLHKINKMQTSWRAGVYPEYNNMTIKDLIARAGGEKSRVFGRPTPHKVTDEVARLASQLPDSFDWRNVDGVNYISPVRNQGGCGSCYAFGSMAMNEARVSIMTGNKQKPVFSPQDIVECSEYSQGCAGGFPYLIGGKYAEDFGIVEESCNPYTGLDGPCKTKASCPRHYSTKYEYVGGFYGACNEPLMRINLVKNGPLAVGFEVYSDFFNYKGGIYHHTGLTNKFDPFELTNHAVLVVGYGADSKTGEKFWIVKNSWGEGWGEKGYFRIRRGTDEVAFESMAVQSFPIV